MSDKNLTELEWKKFSKGKGFKDAAFVKAIAALEKAKDPDAKLAALDDIEKQADVLRKANKADKDLTGYMDDTDKAASKERKLAEFEAKKAAAAKKDDSGDEEEESPALLTTKMVPLLRQVKKGDVMKVMVATAGKDAAVLISKRSISPTRRKLLMDQLGVSGGVKFAIGECIWEENAHTFVLQTQAAGLAKKIKTALMNQTELRCKVRVRGEDPADIDDDGEPAEEMEQAEQDGQEGTQASTIPPAPPLAPTQPTPQATTTATAPDAETAAFNARLAALMPKVKEAITAGGENGTNVKLKVSEAGVFARKKEFPQANALLDDAEKLMAPASTIPPAPPLPGEKPATTAPTTPADPETVAFNARLAALMPKVKEAIVAGGDKGTDVKLKVSEAGVFARKKEFNPANALLDEVEKLISPSAPVADAAQYEARLAAIEARYQDVLKTNPVDANKMRAVFGYASEQAEAEQFVKAVAALGQLEKLLDAAGAEDAKGEKGFKGIVAYRKTLIDLRAAVAKVEGQIANLVKAIPSQMPDEADLAEDLADDLRESNEDLQNLIDEAIGTAKNESEPITRELSARLDALIAEVGSSEVIKHVDSNPFGVALSIGTTLGKALSDVRAALPQPA